MQVITDTQTSKNARIGKLIKDYLNSRNHKNSLNIKNESALFAKLLTATDAIIENTIKKIGIAKTVTDTQKEEASSSLLEEIILEPCKLNTKSSQTVSSQIRSFIYTEDKNFEAQIEIYLRKRAITLLRNYSEGENAEYIKVLNNTRKALNRLVENNKITKSKKDFYSIKAENTNCFNENAHKLKLVNLLNKGEKAKISTIIVKILSDNENLLFSANDLAKVITPIITNRIPNNEIIIQNKVNDNGSEPKTEADFGTYCRAEEIITGKDYFEYFLQSEISDTLTGNSLKAKEKKLALIALMHYSQPGYFFETDVFTEEQKTLSLTDCTANFLNDKRFCGSTNMKSVSRSTANNRLKDASNSLKIALIGLSTEERKSFLRELSGYLTKEFLRMTGVIK